MIKLFFILLILSLSGCEAIIEDSIRQENEHKQRVIAIMVEKDMKMYEGLK